MRDWRDREVWPANGFSNLWSGGEQLEVRMMSTASVSQIVERADVLGSR